MLNTTMYYEPQEILHSLKYHDQEMNYEQLGFLCGLLKEKRPKKIVEVGVAAGGVTCVILKCIESLREKTEVYSIDISKNYWRNQSKKTGYMLEEIPKELKQNHKLLTGKYLAERLEEIEPERDIDFLILDTVHSLPGELFDFIAAQPYLSQNAIVVLHDIVLNHLDGCFEAFATKIVFDVVCADKYYLLDTHTQESKKAGIENIAAFQINNDTKKYMEDCFSALSITWAYFPEEEELKLYRNLVEREYNDLCLRLWDCAIRMQRLSCSTRYVEQDIGNWNNFIELKRKWRLASKICIYGYGMKGKKYLDFALREGLRVDAIVVSDTQPIDNIVVEKIPVYHLSEVPFLPEECTFINAGEREVSIKVIANNIRYAGYYKVLNG